MTLDFLQNDLQAWHEKGVYRSLKSIHSPQGRLITLQARRVLNFSSNDYLGLANDPRLQSAVIAAINEYGLGAGASRLICGNMGPHEALEADLARLKKTESALVYSSGYMANTGTISALMDRHSVVLSDRLNHASILDGIHLSRARLLRYAHADTGALEDMLKRLKGTGRRMIVTDSVFSMDGDRAELKEIADIAARYGAMLMVDEAHGFGVLGAEGGGLVEELGLQSRVDIQMGTLSKAAGCMGGYVCARKTVREYLINKSRAFIYTTAMPPSLAQASRMALKIIAESGDLRRILRENTDFLRNRIKGMGFDTLNSTTPIIPINVKEPLKAVMMSKRLIEKGFFVQAIRPPTVPEGTARLRITVTAVHTREDLDRLVQALGEL